MSSDDDPKRLMTVDTENLHYCTVQPMYNKSQERSCQRCASSAVNQTDHQCLMQATPDTVQMHVENAYQPIGVNLINAMFVMDREFPPSINVQCLKKHYKDQIYLYNISIYLYVHI